MRLFGKPPPVISDQEKTEMRNALHEQRRESEKTLDYVKKVLDRKDELLAEAINQTGAAVRRRSNNIRGAHH